MTDDTNQDRFVDPGATSGQPEALAEYWANLAQGCDCKRCGRKPRTRTEFCDQCNAEYEADLLAEARRLHGMEPEQRAHTNEFLRAWSRGLTYPNGDTR